MAPIMPIRSAGARRSRRSFAVRGAVALVAAALTIAVATPRASLPEGSLKVPAGFEIKLVAGPPLVNRPIAADFDEQGRLYVTDSSGSNDKVEKQLERIIPEELLTRAHHWLILHGRYICVAQRPKCDACPVADLCPSRQLFTGSPSKARRTARAKA